MGLKSFKSNALKTKLNRTLKPWFGSHIELDYGLNRYQTEQSNGSSTKLGGRRPILEESIS